MSKDVNQVQDRLLKMLESVQLDDSAKSAPSAPPAARTAADPPKQKAAAPRPVAGETCSNCHTTESWNGASWCPKCGFYPKLGRQAFQPVEEDQDEVIPETLGEFLAYVPSWVWLVTGSMFGLFVVSVGLRLAFPDIAIRGGIAQLQFFFGVLLFLIAHIRAYFIATHESDKVGPGSFFFQPGEIWRCVFKQLPESNALVASCTSGLMAILLAFTVIGFDYDGIFKPNEQVAEKKKFNPLKYVMQGAQMVAMVQQGGAMAGGGGGDVSIPQEGMGGALEGFTDQIGVNELINANQGVSSSGSIEGALGDFTGTIGVEEMIGNAGNQPTSVSGGGSGNIGEALNGFTGDIGVNELIAGTEGGNGDASGTEQLQGFNPADQIAAQQTGNGSALANAGVDLSLNSDDLPETMQSSFGFGDAQNVQGSLQNATGDGSLSDSSDSDTSSSTVQVLQQGGNGLGATGQEGGKHEVLTIASVPSASKFAESADNVTEFLVFGFTTNASGELRAVFLADMKDNRPKKFAGRFYLDHTDEKNREKMLERFEEIRMSRPLFRTPYRAHWVKPYVVCKIAYNGRTNGGYLSEGRVIEVYDISPSAARSTGTVR